MSSGEYPEELVELVRHAALKALATGGEHAIGPAVLGALAGRLVPEGSEVREEFGVQLAHQSGHGTWDHGSAFVEVYDDQADADQLTAYMASVCDGRPVRTMRRIAAYGPWTPAESAQRSGEEET